MARMLETLNQTHAFAGPAPLPLSPPGSGVASLPPEPPEEDAPLEEEMPYIEVGPRRGVIEGSPGVLGVAPGVDPARRPVLQPTLPERSLPSLSVPVPPPAAASVVFRPAGHRPAGGQPVFAPELIAYHAAGQPICAPYGDLLDHLLGSQRKSRTGAPAAALFFTAGRSEAGTTTVLLNLAITAALQGREVLVVDANLRRPGIAAKLGLGDVPGMREVLAGEFAALDVVRSTGVPGLKALTSGPLAGPARLTITLETVRNLLAECRQNHDVVFIDGSRWDGRPDVTTFGAVADAVYLVVSAGEVDTPAIEGLTQLIPEQGASLAGSILVGR
jgi:Mrp family chromosome partitioning ATPase